MAEYGHSFLKKHNFNLLNSFFLKKLRQTSHKKYWGNHLFQSFFIPVPLALQSMLMGLEITATSCCRQDTDPQHCYRGQGGGLNETIFRFFERKP